MWIRRILERLFERFSRARISIFGSIATACLGLIILLNIMYVHSSLIGVSASIAYVFISGLYIGRVFLSEEDDRFLQTSFGIFLQISLFIFVGTPVVVAYKLDVIGLSVVLFASPLLLAIFPMLKRRPAATPDDEKHKLETDEREVGRFSPVYFVYAILIACCFLMLAQARSGWVYGTVWTVVSPSFFFVYFLSAFVLVGIILYSRTRASSKILSTIVFSLLSTAVFAIVLYPGNAGDPFDHMGFARLIYVYGNLKTGFPLSAFHYYWLFKEKGLALITAVIAKISVVDVYWIHTFILPLLWSGFIPIATFKIGKVLEWEDRVSVLGAFLTSFYVGFTGWASRSTGNSLGFVPFFVSLSFTIWYLKVEKKMVLLLALFTGAVSFLAHPLTGTVSFIIVILAIGLRKYEVMRLKHSRLARLFLMFVFLSGFVVILALFGLNTVIYRVLAPQFAEEAMTRFSLQTLLNTDVWALIFGEYVDYTFKDTVLFFLVPFLGFVGLVYATKRAQRRNDKILVWLMLGAFLSLVFQYTILKYAMVDVLFGPGRLWTFRDFIGIPFVGLVIVSAVEYFEGKSHGNPWRNIIAFKKWSVKLSGRYLLTWLLIGLALSAFGVASVSRGYEWLRGGQPTELEVAAVRYIDENTNGRYVVFTMPTTTQVGWGFVGIWNYMKYYVYSSEMGKLPSVANMLSYMREYEAGVGYFIASFRTPKLEEVVAEASKIFGLFKVLSNEFGKIYIFYYEIPPLPSNYPDPNADVMGFYWDTPPAYFVQNGIMRVIIGNSSLDVADYWGDLYERIDFGGTLVDGTPVGNMTSVERFDSSFGAWVEWSMNESISPSSEFQFKLNFETDSLIGIVERGSPFVRVWWESGLDYTFSLQTGDFGRIYIPGLIGGINSYDVNSREFGYLYTLSRTPNVVLRPAFGSRSESPSLLYSEISNYGNLTVTAGYLSYELYLHNVGTADQWANIEVWLPDMIYEGSWPPFKYSIDDGKTWSEHLAYVDFPKGGPLKTYNGAEVNWFFAKPSNLIDKPEVWRGFAGASGGPPVLVENLTISGGVQNRMLFGAFLPASDRVLLRIGFSVYYSRPLKATYVFTSSNHASYGLLNMRGNTIRMYDFSTSSYVGGWNSTQQPSSLSITQDEAGRIKSARISFPSSTTFYLFAAKGIDTTIDANGDGIPDQI